MELEDCILITVDGEKKWEFECEDNGQFLVSSLKSIVGEDAGTLSYLNPKTGNQRAVKVKDGVFLPPKCGWGTETYWVSKKSSIPSNSKLTSEKVDSPDGKIILYTAGKLFMT